MRNALLARPEMADGLQREWVLPLHGSLSPEEQKRVFDRPPKGSGATKVCPRPTYLLCTMVGYTYHGVAYYGYAFYQGRARDQRG